MLTKSWTLTLSLEGKRELTKQVQSWRGEWGVLWSNTGFQNKGHAFGGTVKAQARQFIRFHYF